MKKFLSAFLGVVLAFSCVFSVSADTEAFDIAVADAAGGILTVSGALESKNNLNNSVSVFMLEKNAALENYAEKTVAMGWAEVDFDTGAYSYSFAVDVPTDTYEFYVVSENKTYHRSYNYVALSDVVKLINDIKSGVVLPKDALSEVKRLNNGLGADLSVLSDEISDDLFALRIEEKRSTIGGETDEKLISGFLNIVKEISDEKIFLNKIKSANQWSEVKLLLQNNDFVTISFDRFNILSADNQTKVLTTFIDREIANADAVKTLFDSEVSKYPVGIIISGGGTGGGGGSSGGGSGVNQRYFDSDVTPVADDGIAVKFNDLKNVPWAAEAIIMLYEKGVVSGVSENQYAPDNTVTREQFAKLLAGALNIYNPGAVCDFSDAQGAWYTPYIASVKEAGLINGIGNNMFGVGQNISRQDMAVMIYNALKYKNIALTDAKNDFSDEAEIADYAKEAVKYLGGAGIISGMGDGNFAPCNNATRAEAAVLIYKMMGRL